nr:SpoIID/LytB domain-containing protein [Cellulomonas sp. APG4]
MRRPVRGLPLVLALALGAGVVAPAAPASAARVLEIDGRGYGHGRGMSQHGAQGRAKAGLTYTQIIAAYYPGTSLGTISDSTSMRVWIQGDDDGVTTVRAENGLSLRTTAGTVALPTAVAGHAPSTWRIRLSSTTLVLEAYAGGAWRTHGTAALTEALAGQSGATLQAADGTLELLLGSTYRDYRGTVSATRVTSGGATTLRTVVTSSTGDYLRSVVPAEMPASWHAQALRSQAVAARTYASWDRDVNVNASWYDTCDTTSCQVYKGREDRREDGTLIRSYEQAATDAAVAATAGRVVLSGGRPAFTQFSASNGGHSAAGSQAYLAAAPDPYDGYAPWKVQLAGTTISARYPAIGTFTSINVLARDGEGPWGGRVENVRINGTLGSVTVTGSAFRSAFGLRSTLWVANTTTGAAEDTQRDWTGDGLADLIGRGPDGKLWLYRGKGDGGFWQRLQIGKGWQTMDMMTRIHGFGGTDAPEIVTTSHDGRLYLYPGDGKGGFTTRVQLGHGWHVFDTLIGVEGWHRDGAPGIIARDAAGSLLLYPGDGRGRFEPKRVIGARWESMDVILSAGDWDGDGEPDLITRHEPTGDLYLYPGTGSGGFRAAARIGNGWGAMDAIVGGADWDGDDRYDLIAREEATGKLWLYRGDGQGGFFPRVQVGNGWTGFSIVN